MKAAPPAEAPASNDADAGPAEEQVASQAASVADLLRAWTTLLNFELILARRSLRWLLIGVIAAPVIGLGTWLGLCALLVATAQAYTHDWALALLLGSGVQLLALAILLHRLRCWAHDLTLPQSRAALARAMERMS
jgi:hypothetical protein